MDIVDRMGRIVDSIEQRLGENPSLDELANEAGLSKYHFHRVFKTVTGLSPGEYVLSRRLAQSVALLSCTTLRTTDIAAELGFFDHSAFSHAFRKAFGRTPTQYRQQPVPLAVRGRWNAADLQGDSQALMTRPDYMMLPGFTVIGRPIQIFDMDNVRYNKANLAGIDFFEKSKYDVQGMVDGDVYIGLTLFPEGDTGYTWYIPSVQTQQDAPVPTGMAKHHVPTQEYAVFHYVGLHHRSSITEHMIPLFQRVFAQWVAQSGFLPRSLFFERIDHRQCSEEYYEVDLCVSLHTQEEEVRV